MSLERDITRLINEKTYNGLSARGLARALRSEENEVKEALKKLERDGALFLAKSGLYFSPARYGMKKAEITRMYSDGAIATYNDNNRDLKTVKVPLKELNGALCYDTVLLSLFDDNYGGVFKVIKQEARSTIGEFKRGPRLYVVPDDVNLPFKIYIRPRDSKNAVDGHKVVVSFKMESPSEAIGKVTKIVGHKDDPGVDITSLLYERKAPIEFRLDAISEAENLPTEISETDLKGREDFRKHLIFTIDGKEAKDLDDAVEISVLDNGNYLLGVHIADVSHYVKKGSVLDAEALTRGTSIYALDRVVPMLPHLLSNGICSLNPHVDRLTLSCVMEINKAGKVVDYRIVSGVINSSYRLNYDDVNAFYRGEFHFAAPLEKALATMKELSDILTETKIKRGALDLDAPEAEIVLDENGKPLDVRLKKTGVGEKLIENFMVIANETTASHIERKKLPYVYRVHDRPKSEKILELKESLGELGYKLPIGKEGVDAFALQQVLSDAQDKDEAVIVSEAVLRSMAKAIYSPINIGHFGLGSACYAHFTSPIRRYPDLIAHRLQKLYASKERYDKEELLETLFYEAGQCSYLERRAEDIERAADDMKKAEYMASKIGETFEGVISGVIEKGFFVELNNTIEGMVKFEAMDEYYVYIPKTRSALGKISHTVLKTGDKVIVKMKGARKERGQIEFSFVKKMTRR